MSKPVLTPWGGVGAVTGANFLLELNNKKYLIDCGLLQGVAGADQINASRFDYDPASIDCLFITHAHADHIGKVPKLVKDGFKGAIYSTPETKDLAVLMLADMAKINQNRAESENIPPLFNEHDVDHALALWQGITYHEVRQFDDFTVEPLNAGHILGSAMFRFAFPSGKSIVFTGDLGNSPSVLLRDTETVTGATYLLMESVYGDRNHDPKEERDRRFTRVLKENIDRKGTLIIPIFALERTQEILFRLDDLFESGDLPLIPVFLDTPLGIHITELFEKVDPANFNDEVQAELKGGDDIFRFAKLKETLRSRDSREIENAPGPKIILAGSGMSSAGRVLGHEVHYLPDANATILPAGYQAPGTIGRQLVEGAKQVTINGETVPVRARIEVIEGFSGHMDSDHLVEFVSHSKDSLKNVFVTMGEQRSALFLAQKIHNELGVEAIVPERGKRYELDL